MRRIVLTLALVVPVAIAVVVIALSSGTEKRTRTPVLPKAPLGELQSPVAPKDETPPGVSAQEHKQIVQENETKAGLVRPRPAAGAQIYSCEHLYGGHLWSTRGPVRPREFVVHYTAGNGTARSIDAYFRRTRAASATFILEPSGRCIQEVPLSEKPWTQLTANPTSISVEIVTTGYNISRQQWLAMPIFQKGILAALMTDAMRPYGIPLHYVDPRGCNFVPGWTDHYSLECGNTHTDVRCGANYAWCFPRDVLQRQLGGARAPRQPSTRAVAQCRQLNRYRRKHASLSAPQRTRAGKLKRNLKRHGYHCGRHGGRTVIVRV